jgi:hypothetical protein
MYNPNDREGGPPGGTTGTTTSAAPPAPGRRETPTPRASGAPGGTRTAAAGAGAVRPRSDGRSSTARPSPARRAYACGRSSPRTSPSARRASAAVCSASLALFPFALRLLRTGRVDRPSHQSTVRARAQGVAPRLPANRRQNNFYPPRCGISHHPVTPGRFFVHFPEISRNRVLFRRSAQPRHHLS